MMVSKIWMLIVCIVLQKKYLNVSDVLWSQSVIQMIGTLHIFCQKELEVNSMGA